MPTGFMDSTPQCAVEQCSREARYFGLCRAHNLKRIKYGDPTAGREHPRPVRRCSVDGCDREHRALGYCERHHHRFKLYGDPLGGRDRYSETPPRKNGHGYMQLYRPDHPNANSGGRVMEHHFVMAEALGRPIRPGEMVHHKNGVRDDNRIENLELCLKRQPPGQRVDDLIDWAIEFLREYRPDVLAAADACGPSHTAGTAARSTDT